MVSIVARSETPIDYGLAAEDCGAYRQGFPVEFFRKLHALQVGLPGQRLLDLGTGTGLLAREFARRGCLVTGVDFSARLLRVAEAANAARWCGPPICVCGRKPRACRPRASRVFALVAR